MSEKIFGRAMGMTKKEMVEQKKYAAQYGLDKSDEDVSDKLDEEQEENNGPPSDIDSDDSNGSKQIGSPRHDSDNPGVWI